MTSPINIDAYSDALVVLGTAGIVVPVVRRWGLNPTLGYLGAGAILGPLGLGSFTKSFPFLYWLTIVDAQNVAGIAELGVVFLLFLIGLGLSFNRLTTMRRLVFGLGGLQVLLTASLFSVVAAALGQGTAAAIIIGTSLALSSTAIVLELLSDQGRLNTTAGRASFSVLLAQDLAVIPLLLFVSVLGVGSGGSVMGSLTGAVLRAAIAITLILLFGRLLLRPLFRLVANTHSTELFVAAGLFVIVAAGLIAHQADLSMALGAFIAGLVLAETEYGKAIETVVEPFKGLLLGIFFFTVGMNIDFREFLRQPISLAAAVVCLIVAKSVILTVLARLFRTLLAFLHRDRIAAGAGRRICFRRYRSGRCPGTDWTWCVELHDRFDIDNNGLDAIVVHRRTATGISSRAAPGDRSRVDCPAAAWRDACNCGRLWPHRKSRVLAAQRARHNVYRRRP